MTPLFELYGLMVSAPVPLPAPIAPRPDLAPDVIVHFGERPAGASAWREEGESPVYVSEDADHVPPELRADRPADAHLLRLRYAEGIRFHIADDGRSVWADWTAPLTEADAVSFLVGPVLGIVLRRHGVLALHASAVVQAGRAWAFLGPGGSGKSTLVAACVKAGMPMLTEDVVAVRRERGDWHVARGYSQVRIWEEALPLMPAGARALLPLSPTWPKRTLDLVGEGLPFAARSMPLGGVLVLDDLRPPGLAPALARLAPVAALMELVANAFVNHLLDPGTLARELPELASISRGVPVWRLASGAGLQGVAETVALLAGLIPGE